MNINEISIIKGINNTIYSKKSSKARLNAVLSFIQENGSNPVVFDHLTYKSTKLVLFIYEEMVFSVKINSAGGFQNFCRFLNKEESLKIKENFDTDKQEKLRFLNKLSGWRYSLDLSFNSAKISMYIYNTFFIKTNNTHYRDFYKKAKKEHQSTQKLQILLLEK